MHSLTFMEEDPFAPIRYCYQVEEVLYSANTGCGQIKVLASSYFGRMLVLNGVVQLTERDEHIYHEMLVHVPLHVHTSPSDVLIIGGGDGGSLREVLKHDSVNKATLVEMDKGVIETSQKFFPTLSTGFSDPRTRVIIAEGAGFLSRTPEKFDVIIIDSTDPVGPAESLFTRKFFADAFASLKADGIFVAQTESLHFHQQFVSEVQHKLAQEFPLVHLYTAPIATYAGNWWTFSIASKKHNPKQPLTKHQVETTYYAEDVHRQAFLPDSLYDRIVKC